MVKVPTIEVILFMVRAHQNHSPRMNNEPYYSHPLACIQILREVLGVKTDETDQAMALHDVEEDHEEYTLEKLRDLFGEPADLAHWLCKPPRPEGVDKFVFNLNCYRSISHEAPPVCAQMKIADRLHNLSDPERWSRNFHQNYIKDTANLIVAFSHVPNIQLVCDRLDIIRDGKF